MTCLAITEFSRVRHWCHVSFSVASVLVDQWYTLPDVVADNEAYFTSANSGTLHRK